MVLVLPLVRQEHHGMSIHGLVSILHCSQPLQAASGQALLPLPVPFSTRLVSDLMQMYLVRFCFSLAHFVFSIVQPDLGCLEHLDWI
jgi:hypothetical protein